MKELLLSDQATFCQGAWTREQFVLIRQASTSNNRFRH
ncbi:unnamed protein product [Pelagomonas calceolata]|uniref:Uncharacterized protein n=1 Tax=Pelagomonas calceolata TaxID=35677 RepID=A0A8J2SQ94_9STRA|nr:unnamed protein product [Pelagomonas calceolata]